MKKTFVLILFILCFCMPCLVSATEVNLEDIKAKITVKPEDVHPNGINMEIGTASFWLEVKAEVSGESGEKVSYQWYESKTGYERDLVPLENETKSIFIPEQKIGTTYYCAGVITTLGEESVIEYTKLLEATFTPKMIDEIWITNVKEPKIGETPSNSAEQYTNYELNNYYGYEIKEVSWLPNDNTFNADIEYTINIEIEYWDNVEFINQVDTKINDKRAELIPNETGDGAIITYTFEKLVEEKEELPESGENLVDEEKVMQSGENKFEAKDEEKLDISAVILCAIFAVVMVFALMLIVKRR